MLCKDRQPPGCQYTSIFCLSRLQKKISIDIFSTEKVCKTTLAVVLDSLHVNGRLTPGENLADFGGLALPETAANLLLTNPHSPAQYRALIPLQQMQEFYDAFGIKEGDKMWLPVEKRVHVW